MKYAILTLLLTIPCLRVDAGIEIFGECSSTLGAGKYLQQSASGYHPGGTVHCMAGLQYGVLAVQAGLGIIILSDPASDVFHIRRLQPDNIDLPAGASLRFPLNQSIIAVGADISGLLGDRALMIEPHIDLLFERKKYRKWIYRGIFLKALADMKRSDHSFMPQYFGIGFKTTFG